MQELLSRKWNCTAEAKLDDDEPIAETQLVPG
jgi:hypothetical protein